MEIIWEHEHSTYIGFTTSWAFASYYVVPNMVEAIFIAIFIKVTKDAEDDIIT